MLEVFIGAAILLLAFDVVNPDSAAVNAFLDEDPIHSILVLIGAVMIIGPFVGLILQELLGGHLDAFQRRVVNARPVEALTSRLGFEDMRMSPADQKVWRSARTVLGLARIGARYLRGEIASQPGYAPNTPVDPETHDLMPAIVTANEAGFWTTCSSSGDEGPNGEYAGVRASVSGYLDEDHYPIMIDVLEAAVAAGAGLTWRAERVSRPQAEHAEHGKTKRMGCRPAGFRYFREHYGTKLHIAAFGAVLASWEIAIEATDPGNDVMNRVLTDYAAACDAYFRVGEPA